MIYLDNASTSYPKSPTMLQAMERYQQEIGVSPYRGSHSRTKAANQQVYQLRSELGALLGVRECHHICFTYNATYAINLLLKGFLKPGDHVIISSYEHNSVVRPLHDLKKKNLIDYDVWPCNAQGIFRIEDLEQLVRPETRLLFLSTHSNVLGMPIPLNDVVNWLRGKKIHLGLDCTQTLGHLPLNLDALSVDMAVGTGHKGLLGPPGIGFLYVKDPDLVDSLIQGGGGHLSAELDPPDVAPAKYEAGTLNFLAIAGLLSSLRWQQTSGYKQDTAALFAQLREGLKQLPGVQIYGSLDSPDQIPLLAFNIDSCLPSQVESYLDRQQIIVRAGLHCAPLIHQALGTFPHGAVRVSLSLFNNAEQIAQLLHHLSVLCTHCKNLGL